MGRHLFALRPSSAVGKIVMRRMSVRSVDIGVLVACSVSMSLLPFDMRKGLGMEVEVGKSAVVPPLLGRIPLTHVTKEM